MVFNSKLKKHSITVFNFGLIDNAEKANEILSKLKSESCNKKEVSALKIEQKRLSDKLKK